MVSLGEAEPTIEWHVPSHIQTSFCTPSKCLNSATTAGGVLLAEPPA